MAGTNKWMADRKTVSAVTVKAKPKPYKGAFNRNVLANRDYVAGHLQKDVVIDAREAEYYSGKAKVSSVSRAGHIPGTANLPISLAFNPDGTFQGQGGLGCGSGQGCRHGPVQGDHRLLQYGAGILQLGGICCRKCSDTSR